MKKRILQKVTSTKFWSYVSVFVLSVCAFFHFDEQTETQIGALIIALGNVIVYTFGNITQKHITNKHEQKMNEIEVKKNGSV